eukprot:1247546-Amphidinium_carterae.1
MQIGRKESKPLFRSVALCTKASGAMRDKTLSRWLKWGQEEGKIKYDEKTMSILAVEFAGGEDWVQMEWQGVHLAQLCIMWCSALGEGEEEYKEQL